MTEAYAKLIAKLEDKYLLLLSGVVALVFLSNLRFIIVDKEPQAWDQAIHMYYSLIYSQLIKGLDFGSLAGVSNYYPPCFHLSSVPLYFIFGFSEDVAIATNLLYYLLLVFSVYKIGNSLRGRKTGVMAAVLVSFYPMLNHLQHTYLIDFALTSLCAFTIYLFIRTENFNNLGYSALFGISLGLCELMKWTAFVFVLPAVGALYLQGVRERLRVCAQCGKPLGEKFKTYQLLRFCSKRCVETFRKAGASTNVFASQTFLPSVAIASLLAFISLAWWYLPNFAVMSKRLTHFASIGGLEGDPTVFTLDGWIYYASALSASMGIIFFILALASIIILVRTRDKDLLFIFASVGLPYLILTVVSNKGDRYIAPVLPIFALSTSLFLTQLPLLADFSTRLSRLNWKKVERVLLGLVILVGVLQLTTVTVGVPAIMDEHWLYPAPETPKTDDWKIEGILETIQDNGGTGNVVVVLPDQYYLNGQSLDFYRLKGGYDFRVYNGVYVGYDVVKSNFDQIKFFILIEPREQLNIYGSEETRLYELFYENKGKFSEIGALELPDGTTLFIYKREE